MEVLCYIRPQIPSGNSKIRMSINEHTDDRGFVVALVLCLGFLYLLLEPQLILKLSLCCKKIQHIVYQQTKHHHCFD